MSFVERLEQLDREVAAAIDAGLGKLRTELAEHLRSGHEEALRRLSSLSLDLPKSFASGVDLTPDAQETGEARAEGRADGHADLRDALVAIDAARSQADVLGALLEQSHRFSARAAVLLVRPGAISGWGGRGLGDVDVRGLSLGRTDGLGARVGEDTGTLSLSASECLSVTGPLGIAPAREGVAVPMVLRDRVAAVLYADARDGEPLDMAGLQVLTYAAALAIETLPFRERARTTTLGNGATGAAESAIAAPVPAAPAAAPPAVVVPVTEAPPVAEAVAVEVPASSSIEAPIEPPIEVPIEAPIEAVVEAESEGALPPLDLDSSVVSVGEPLAFSEPAPAWSAPEPELPVLAAEPELPVLAEPELPAFTIEPELPAFAEPELPAVAAAPEPVVESVPSGHETVLLRSLPDLSPRAPEPPAPEPLRVVGESAEGPRTAEVRPPSGVQGPGWAFSTGRMQTVAAEDEALHEEARRLARLLVSEIKLYNEEQVEAGRRNRDVYERLKEDIDRSRQMYEERVERRVVSTTDYFYQELVRILGGGDARTLGI